MMRCLPLPEGLDILAPGNVYNVQVSDAISEILKAKWPEHSMREKT